MNHQNPSHQIKEDEDYAFKLQIQEISRLGNLEVPQQDAGKRELLNNPSSYGSSTKCKYKVDYKSKQMKEEKQNLSESDDDDELLINNRNKKSSHPMVESSDEDRNKVTSNTKKLPCFPDEQEYNSEGSETMKRTLRQRTKKTYLYEDDSDSDERSTRKRVKKIFDSDEEYVGVEVHSSGKQKIYGKCGEMDTTENEEFCTPGRKSSRLHNKDIAKGNKTIPKRRDVLNEISPQSCSVEPKTFSSSKKLAFSNDYVMGRHTYNTERCYESDDSIADDDFIVSDDIDERNAEDSDEREHRKRKKRKRSRKSLKKVKKIDSDSEENNSGDDEVCLQSEIDSNLKHDKLNKIENYKSPKILQYETPKTPEGKKILPKRSKNKHYEKSLERLRKSRQNKNNEDKSDKGSSSSEGDNWDDESDLHADDDFIDDEDECVLMSENDNLDDDLKDVIAGLKKKTKHLEKADVELKKQRVLTSSSEEISDEETIMSEIDNQFMELVTTNDVNGVKNLLKVHDLVNKLGNGNKTALHIAAMLGHVTMAKLLVSKSANTTIEDKLKSTPLGYAAKNKHPKCFKFLLEKAELVTFCRNLYKNFEGMNLLHLIVSEPLSSREYLVDDIVACLEIVYSFNSKMFMKLLSLTDSKSSTPLRNAIMQDQVEVVKFLLKYIFVKDNTSNECSEFTTEEGGNILHFATQYSRNCLAELIPYLSYLIDESDNSGFTPLMYAAERYGDCLEVLLNFNASVHVKDNDDVTPLHLAASCGNLQSINLLLNFGHKVDCLDSHGWPPLLYANFRASEECVITLFEKNPSQIFCLGNLINDKNREQRRKNAKIIQDTLLSISHIDAYYTLFNAFIASNLSLLDENNHGCFTKTWRVILSFKNKVKWLRKKCYQSWVPSYVEIDRSCILESAIDQLHHTFTFNGMNVTFKDEAGRCLGPKREFCTLLIEDMTKPERKLFTKTDGEQYIPVPNEYFFERMQDNPHINYQKSHAKDELIEGDTHVGNNLDLNITDQDMASFDMDDLALSSHVRKKYVDSKKNVSEDGMVCKQEGISTKQEIAKTMKEYKNELDEHLEMIRFAGQFCAQVILDEEIHVGLQLSKPFVKQILGIALNHPDELSSYDHQLFSNIKDNNVEDLELPFSVMVSNPWNGDLEEILLGEKKEELIMEENKQDYLNCLSEFKLNSSISKELAMFKKGFFNAIRRDVISIFNADEFSLLLNGVTKIDIHDWRINTRYCGWSSASPVILWFWSVVGDLIEEEKSLLLKFATGTPCVPAGGFSQLMGLSGATQFTIGKRLDLDKLPEAATCFNLLNLPEYTNEKILREKLLIAIRHGCEGFAFE